MTQKVLRVGTSAAVTIPGNALRELGFRIGMPVEVTIDKKAKSVTYRPQKKSAAPSAREKRIADLTYDFIERYRKDLESLAGK
jgi:antitoxin component of MazEF toxin-antitoxin module